MAKKIQRSSGAPAQAPARQEAAPSAGGAAGAPRRRTGRVARQLVTEFTIQLATLSEAGIPIVKALTILEGQTRPGPFKGVLQDLVEDVSSGTPLSESMAKHPKVFDRLYTSMVRAGEAGGVLDKVLQRQAIFMERAAEIRAKVVGAMIYPSVILFVAVAVVSAVIVWIIPKFNDIFRSFKITMPAITQFLLDLSEFTVAYWYLVFGLPLLLFVAHVTMLARSQPYRYRVHKLMLKLPVLGPILNRSLVGAFARTFGTLIQAGVPHLDALAIVRDASRNEVLMEGVESIRKTVREGEGIARPMGETGLFDDLVTNMVDVGEATGELDKMLMKVADAYEQQVERRINAMFKLIEPALLIVVAGFVGFIVVALFLPLMTIMSSVGTQ
ncbi:MAG: type II secretion system F family protein [Planctomycetes bacterium]|nr:type II secretion system F family protein [Planctomycetota bacterium]